MHQTYKIIKILVSSTVIFIAAFLAWLSFLDGHFSITQAIAVKQPKDTITNIINHLEGWEAWSPWMDSGIEHNGRYTPRDGKGRASLHWEHILAGSTTITNTDLIIGEKKDTINQLLQISKPFPCQIALEWHIKETGEESTSMQLTISGTLPFLYRFLARRMETILSMDMMRSLKLLKDYAELGNVASHVSIVGFTRQEDFQLIGLHGSCPSHALDSAMQETFLELTRLLELNNMAYTKTVSCYYDFGINANKECQYLCGVIAATTPCTSALPAPLTTTKIKGTKTLKISYTGEYRHLDNAWVTGLTYLRAKGFKARKRIPAYEVYVLTDATTPAPHEWRTELYIPVR